MGEISDMVTVSIDEAQKDLRKIIAQAERGELVLITRDGQVIATVAGIGMKPIQRVPGYAKGGGATMPYTCL
jgi:antitoxin (DNA-binding transcriptional repressor) of toxin-antitoxin stability system